MSLYFDYKVQNPDLAAINLGVDWHHQHSLLAVSSYSESKGGFVSIYDELGEALPDISWPSHPMAQVTSLAWHPLRKALVIGWENGELRVWGGGDPEFVTVQSPHQAPVTVLQWSHAGGRLVSADAAGALLGWKMDSRGQLLSVFHVEMREPLGHVTFRRPAPGVDITGLAKAAVAGDEHALDLLSSWRPRTAGARTSIQGAQPESLCFYIGSFSGKIFHCNEEGICMEVLSTDGSQLRRVLHHEHLPQLAVLTDVPSLGHFSCEPSGQLSEIVKVKLVGRPQDACAEWAGPGLVAVAAGDATVRLWDLASGESCILSADATGTVTSIAYCPQKVLLCAGTSLGQVLMWRRTTTDAGSGGATGSSGADSDSWILLRGCQLHGSIKQLSWGGTLLAANTITTVFILREQRLCAAYTDTVSAVQISPNVLQVQTLPPAPMHYMELKVDLQVSGVAVSSQHIAAWSARTLAVYQLLPPSEGATSVTAANMAAKSVATFACEVDTCVLYEENLVVLSVGAKLDIRTLHGTIKQTLSLGASEGQPIVMSLCGSFLTVASSLGIVRLWNLSHREAKQHGRSRNLDDELPDFGEVMLACSNCTGTRVSITVARSNFQPDPRLYVWDMEADTLSCYDTDLGRMDSLGSNEEPNSLPVMSGDSGVCAEIRGRLVVVHCWDCEEPRLLVCQAKRIPRSKEATPGRASSATVSVTSAHENSAPSIPKEDVLVTFFSTDESALVLHDVISLKSEFSILLGVRCPHYILLRSSDCTQEQQPVDTLLMRDFEGLSDCDRTTRDAILTFSYQLSAGNMDEAFRAIRAIQSETVWSSLARMCVKTRRLDVAWVCLGHMQHGRAAFILRQAASEPELEARVGILALQLGLRDEAMQLFRQCGRHDLEARALRSLGQWEEALKVTEQHDRIHLRNMRHRYALNLEARGDRRAALQALERADTHRSHAPRLLTDNPRALEAYVLRDRDPQLLRWWAQYLESMGQLDEALSLYREANDFYCLVRVLCFRGDLDGAAEVAQSSGDPAACYHLARQLESQGQSTEAVGFYSRAHAYSNAIRICKEQGLDDQLWNLSLLAGPRDQLDVARYFEKSFPDRAVRLYHRAGMIHQAVNLAFRTQQYNALQYIAIDLDAKSDPELVQKCAQFFFENKQYEKAVDLLAVTKQHVEALELCLEHNVPVTEELAEKLTLAKGETDEATRVHVLEKVAECAIVQANYHLAAKKFLQAGSTVKAMKALLKSGDTERIIYFATTSRQRDIYVMAANYLQSLDWQSDPEILKNIVAFYTKGHAYDLLANFYVACAQVEVDEYRNYEKALGALGEASRCLARVTNPKDPSQHERAVETVTQRAALVKRFIDVLRLFARGEKETAETQCTSLIHQIEEGPSPEGPLRRGDVLAAVVEDRAARQDWNGARNILDQIRQLTGDPPARYVSISTLEAIANGLGLPSPRTQSVHEIGDEEVEEEEGLGTGARPGTSYASSYGYPL
ncbi:intraflagellar transport protein 140 homolog [Schistocerca nitens]|uniref:intraflagellar transport protein 140 homolog n=1 Tax=Schistocerca nitens TaxID=7011 RepID=UPI002118CD2F|nr:intraflagellar transport protein 140 homolog [Schistocerca nitens]